MILGVDEAGRGPWAGPLVVGAVVLGGREIDGLTDSKKLSKKKREALYEVIVLEALSYASGWVSALELDDLGMSESLRLATRRAVEQIKTPHSEIIIDGTINFLADTGKGGYVKTMAKADLLVPSVSAASIVAKVERDRYMATLDNKYPGYSFKSHAGYGVAKHRAAIAELGVTPEHRLSFAPLVEYRKNVQPFQKQVRRRRDTLSGTTFDSAELTALKQSWSRKVKPGKTFGSSYTVSSKAAHSSTKFIGDEAEAAAAEYLQKQGHVILGRNWRTKFCEIDIVSQKGGVVYFSEVKHRKNDKADGGIAYITAKKLQQMQFAAKLYAHNNRLKETDLRLTAIATVGTPPEVIEHIEIV